jgi:hypothetical protein
LPYDASYINNPKFIIISGVKGKSRLITLRLINQKFL